MFVFQERSEVIATYALCGFANIGSIGIMIGSLSAMAPQRKSDIAAIAVRAMIAGNVACFMTACIAGKSCMSLNATYTLFQKLPNWNAVFLMSVTGIVFLHNRPHQRKFPLEVLL